MAYTSNGNKISEYRITGLVAATFTPFSSDGELNLDIIPNYADHLLANGVKGAFVCGTAGEYCSLTIEERKRVAGAWMGMANRPENVIIQVGSNCLKESIELASHAEKLGVDAISTVAPFFLNPSTLESLVSFCQEIADAAPNTPFLYYHNPPMTGVDMDMVSFMKLAGSKIPTFRGLKYSSMDFYQGASCLRVDNFMVMCGVDQMLLGAVAMGFTSAVGSTYNYVGRLNNILFTLNSGDDDFSERLKRCREAQRKAQELLTIATKSGSEISGIKQLMCLHGIDVGPPRPPLPRLTPQQIETMKEEFNKWTLSSEI